MNPGSFILERDAVMRSYTADVAAYCAPFSCEDSDLDEFFSKDAFLYETELLGKTYAWINTADPSKILGLELWLTTASRRSLSQGLPEIVCNAASQMPSEE